MYGYVRWRCAAACISNLCTRSCCNAASKEPPRSIHHHPHLHHSGWMSGMDAEHQRSQRGMCRGSGYSMWISFVTLFVWRLFLHLVIYIIWLIMSVAHTLIVGLFGHEALLLEVSTFLANNNDDNNNNTAARHPGYVFERNSEWRTIDVSDFFRDIMGQGRWHSVIIIKRRKNEGTICVYCQHLQERVGRSNT